jgi:hypothetical protein
MAVEDADDRATFLEPDEHGETVVIGSGNVDGIFDNAYLSVDAAQAGIVGTKPAFICQAADVSAITIGTSTLVRLGTTYKIVNQEPDGAGMTVLILERQ